MTAKTMRVVRSDSNGPSEWLDLAVALVDYIQESQPGNVSAMVETCRGIWPNYKAYFGDTHIRIWPEKSNHQASFYVDLSGERMDP